MIEGMDEVRSEMKRLLERVDSSQRSQADMMQAELNKIRSQFREAMRRMPVAEQVMVHASAEASEGSQQKHTASNGGESPGDGEEDEEGRRHRHAPPGSAAEALMGMQSRPGALGVLGNIGGGTPNRRDSSAFEPMPAEVQRGPASPLVPRLRLKHCITDDAVPTSLRCATLVVGRRLFLFPRGRDGMCDLQFAMVMDLVRSHPSKPKNIRKSRPQGPPSSPPFHRFGLI